MPDFDPFSSGAATATAEPARAAGGFDPFASGLAEAPPAAAIQPWSGVTKTDPDAHWRSAYGGLDDMDKRLDPAQSRAFTALDKISRNPPEDRARAVNQSFLGEKLKMDGAALQNNWGAVKSAFAKQELGVDQADIPDKTLYGWIGQRLAPAAATPNPEGADRGELKPWTWTDRLSSDAYAVKHEAGRLMESIFKPFKELPAAPANLPDVWVNAGRFNAFRGDVPFNPAVAAGVWNGAVKPLVDGLESPAGIATLGVMPALEGAAATSTAAKVAFKGISGLFAGLMGLGTYESAKEIQRLRKDPNATTQDYTAAISGTVTNGAMALLGAFAAAFHKIPERAPALAKELEGKPPGRAAELLRQEAVTSTPEAADALSRAAAHLDELGGYTAGPAESLYEGKQIAGEKIAAAAVRAPDGTIATGPSHQAINREAGSGDEVWFRGVRAEGEVTADGDRFYTASRGVAEEWSNQTGEPGTVIEKPRSELPPKDQLFQAYDKETLAEELGISQALLDNRGLPFDEEVKRILKARGFKGVEYEAGTDPFGGGENEIHVFGEGTPAGHTEGFVTNQGRFVNRVEAKAIAEEGGQLVDDSAGPAHVMDRIDDPTNAGIVAEKPAPPAKTNPDELHSHQVTYDEPHSAFGQTALKNAYGELERDAYGFGDAPETERRDMAERWARSAEVLQRNPEAGRALADRLLKNPNIGLTDDQSALLLRHKVGLQRALNEAADALHDPNSSPALKEEAAAQVKDLSGQLVRLLDAVNRRGSEWGREGRWRQALAREDYSFAAQETLLRAANGGAELTPEETAALSERVKALEAAQTKFQAEIDRLTAEPREAAADRAVRAMAKPPAGAPRRVKLAESIREKLHAKAAESRKFLAGKVLSPTPEDLYHMAVIGADQIYSVGLDFAKWSSAMVGELGEKVRPLLGQIWDAAQKHFHTENRAGLVADLAALNAEDRIKRLSGIAQELARSHIAQGVTERGAVVDAVHADIVKAVPDVTRREAMDAISGYGQFKPLTHDQITDQLRDVKGQLQQVAKLEDMAAGQAPKKTGMERRALSDEERRLVQQVEEKKKAGGYDVTDPDKQLRTALQAAETRLTNEISDVENQLKNEAPFDPAKKAAPTSPKIDALKKQLAELKDRRDYMREAMQPGEAPRTRAEAALQSVKTRLASQIKDLEKQIATGVRTEKTKGAVAYDDQAARLKARRDELQAEFDRVFGRKELTDEQRLNIWKAGAERRVAELQDRLAAGDFSPPAKRSPPPMDKAAWRLKGELERLKQDFAIERAKAEEAKQPKAVRALRKVSDLARASALSGYHTLLKLASYSAARFAEKPIAEAVGAAFAKIPGFRAIFANASMEAGAEYRGLAKFYTKAATDGMRDAWETLRTGKSTLKAELGDPMHNERPVHWYDYFGLSHMSEKSPLLRGEFELRLEKLNEWTIANGMDVTDPMVQAANRKLAFDYAQHEILQENNQFSDWLNTLTSRMEKANPKTGKVDVTKQALATFVKTFLTKGIVKTPSNYIMQTLKRTPLGLAKGTAETIIAHMQGVGKLTPEETNAIARLIKLGSVGSAVFVWGMLDAAKDPKDRIFGGYYQPGEKRGDEDVGFGKIRVNGWEIPHLLSHNPLTESAQMGSTFYRVTVSKLRKKDKEDKGALAGAATALLSLASEAPIVSPITRSAADVERGEAHKLVWGFLSGLVPMFVTNLAQDIDKGRARRPETLTQAIEANIPGMRGDVPLTKAQKKRDIKERSKNERTTHRRSFG